MRFLEFASTQNASYSYSMESVPRLRGHGERGVPISLPVASVAESINSGRICALASDKRPQPYRCLGVFSIVAQAGRSRLLVSMGALITQREG